MLKYEQESINFSKFYILCFAFLFEVCLQYSLFSNELCLSLHRHINLLSTTEMTTSGECSFFSFFWTTSSHACFKHICLCLVKMSPLSKWVPLNKGHEIFRFLNCNIVPNRSDAKCIILWCHCSHHGIMDFIFSYFTQVA